MQIRLLIITFLLSSFSFGQKLTYYKDIVPIFNEKCLPCHRESGYGPFSLASYHDVAKRAKFIGYVTEQGIMPPWKADHIIALLQIKNC